VTEAVMISSTCSGSSSACASCDGEVEMKVWMRRAWRLHRLAAAVDVVQARRGRGRRRRAFFTRLAIS
jgi:hypothetical protein